MSLLAAAIEESNLFEAWKKVRANGGMAGCDGQSLEQFAVNVFGRLQTLAHQALHQQYRPQALRELAIPKDDGQMRYLAIPAVRDRVLQTAVTRVLAPELEREFEHASYAYRAGRSVPMAVARVAHYRDQGFHWVVDADIRRFFDQVNHTLLLDKLRRTLPEHSLLPLISLWLAATVQPDSGPPRLLDKGIPQGSPLSPLLANLYLDDFDEALLDENLRLVRFADDFLILCRSQQEAEQALELTESVIDSLKLALNPDKTRITDFETGFRFLGVDFIRNIMAAADPLAGQWLLPNASQRRDAAFHDQADGREKSMDAGRETPAPPDAPPRPDEPSPLAEAPAEACTASEWEPADDTDAAPTADGVLEPALEPTTTARGRALTSPLDFDPSPEPEPEHPLAQETGEPGNRVQHHPELSPLLRTLLVTEQGVALLKEHERVVVARQHEVLLSWPLGKLDEIMVIGNALVSTALLRTCTQRGIAVSFSNHQGQISAMLNSQPWAQQVPRLARQLAWQQDPEHALMFARAMAEGKIHNQRVLLRRYNRRRQLQHVDLAEAMMTTQQRQLPHAASLDAIRGHEGQAARLYFAALVQLIPPEWGFSGRNRRPATDPVNAMLSLGYGMLHKTVLTCLQRQQLHPALGHLHAVKTGHAALASDLMEEFRAPVVDTTVLQAILSRQISCDAFTWEDGASRACQLLPDGRKRLLQALAAKYRAQLIHPRAGMRMDYHRAILYQVNHYRAIADGQQAVYHAFKLR